ncbi:MAG: hypothetical protein IPQ05_04365 [Leptospiraceae bacterium]|nr:hypothetical protein [Leptospiraceae bacterium]
MKILFILMLFLLNINSYAGKEEKEKDKCEKYISKGYLESEKLTKKPVLKIDFSLKDFFPKAAKEKEFKKDKLPFKYLSIKMEN